MTITVRSLIYVSALALSAILSFSLAAEISLNGGDSISLDLFSTDTDTDYNLFSDEDPTLALAFSDIVDPPADPDIDFMLASGCSGGGENGNFNNKLRRRGNVAPYCENEKRPTAGSDVPNAAGAVKVPDLFDPDNPGIEGLGTKTKTQSGGRCPWEEHPLNVCCTSEPVDLIAMGPPPVWRSVFFCYLNVIGDAPCPTRADACCESIDKLWSGQLCVVIGQTINGRYTAIDPYPYPVPLPDSLGWPETGGTPGGSTTGPF